MGSPTFKFLSIVQGKLKSFAMINLKILLTFILCVALEKNRVAFIALAYALACVNVPNINLEIKPKNMVYSSKK